MNNFSDFATWLMLICSFGIVFTSGVNYLAKLFERKDNELLAKVAEEEAKLEDLFVDNITESMEDGRPPRPQAIWDEANMRWTLPGRAADDIDLARYRSMRSCLKDSLIVIHSSKKPEVFLASTMRFAQGIVWVREVKGEMSEAWTLDHERGRWRELTDSGSGISNSLIGTNDTLLAIRSVNHKHLKAFSNYIEDLDEARKDNPSVSQLALEWQRWLGQIPRHKRATILSMLSVQDDIRVEERKVKRSIDLT